MSPVGTRMKTKRKSPLSFPYPPGCPPQKQARYKSVSSTRDRNVCAFSLIEMLIVLLLISIVLGLAIPRIGVLPQGVRIRRTINVVRRAFHAAATMAVCSGRPVTLNLDFSAHAIRIVPGATSSPAPDGRPRNSIFDNLKRFPLDSEIKGPDPMDHFNNQESTAQRYKFYPNGEAEGPAMILKMGRRQLKLNIDRLTGRPEIYEMDD